MNSFELYNIISRATSKLITRKYSTSFSLGISFLHASLRAPIYAVYGFVRLGDEIVDTFHDYDKKTLIKKFRKEVFEAIEQKISLNPILHSFQMAVNRYNICLELVEQFIHSMEMDLHRSKYSDKSYEEYILGSAEVVGLMCLAIFCNGDKALYNDLKEDAMSLGSAYQKVNFLRDLNHDYEELGRVYFPCISIENFNNEVKNELIEDIAQDFERGARGIRRLPRYAKFGVFLSYVYYKGLLNKIKQTPAKTLLKRRIRLPNWYKYSLLFYSFIRSKLRLI